MVCGGGCGCNLVSFDVVGEVGVSRKTEITCDLCSEKIPYEYHPTVFHVTIKPEALMEPKAFYPSTIREICNKCVEKVDKAVRGVRG